MSFVAAFQYTDPKTGIKYTGAEGQARWVAAMTGKPYGGAGAPSPLQPLPDPPVGTYDPAIDYNAGASNRGHGQTVNDAQTAYEQGQQDHGLGLGDLTTGRDRTLAGLLTNKTRLDEDTRFQADQTQRQYGILGRQQAEGAAQRGITSQGLLGKSQAVRGANEQRDLGQINLARTRGLDDISTAEKQTYQDFDRGKLGLDLGNARTFGGFNGQTILNPLTNQPEFGSLLTGVTRAGGENNAFQAFSSGQRGSQAAQGGYISPLTRPIGGVSLGKAPLTRQQYQSGFLLDALLGRR